MAEQGTAARVIEIAKNEIGYLEKKSNNNLQDKTANAGYNNWTKYGEWYGLNGGSQAPWCCMFVSWVCDQAGVPTSIVPKTAGCAYMRDWFKNKNRLYLAYSKYKPVAGDFVLFSTSDYPNGSGHIGIVTSSDNNNVYTIEGNTSGGSSVIDNGGGCVAKQYSLNNSRIYGYCHPEYKGVDSTMKYILIIAGHGGSPYDPGACACGYKEAKLTRELANLLYDELKNVAGVTPIKYDQSNDAYKILKNGGALPLSNISYVVELHFNAGVNDPSGNGSTTGVEVLVHTSESGITVEENICKKISALGFKNRGVKRSSGLLVMNTVKKKYGISHALIETCFIDDKDDMKLYNSKKKEVAKAIAMGIADGFGYKYTYPIASSTPNTTTAKPSNVSTINPTNLEVFDCQTKQRVTVSAVNISGYNYIKMKDLEKFSDATVSYDEKKNLPAVNLGRKVTPLKINIGGKDVSISHVNQNWTNYVGIRELLEYLGYKVDWDYNSQTVIISSENKK